MKFFSWLRQTPFRGSASTRGSAEGETVTKTYRLLDPDLPMSVVAYIDNGKLEWAQIESRVDEPTKVILRFHPSCYVWEAHGLVNYLLGRGFQVECA